ncbi:MAG TPA: VWA domain-containing protein [Gemmataceae bacterium]|nr:VWA domain-containing protein [Gemmataceae bacterium]
MPTSIFPLLGFLFGDPLALLAAVGGAVSIPIIIHLLNRRRFRVVNWAAMRFLLAAQRQNTRRMRLEQIILLAVRALVVALLILAMASVRDERTDWTWWQYLFPSSTTAQAASASRRAHKILVLDGSFSMALKVPNPHGEGETTCFERARALALEIIDRSSGGDGFSVVLMGAPPKRVVPGLSDVDVKKVRAEVQALRLPHGNADLAATLNTVESLLRESPGKYHDREVYFLTDLQRSTWISPQPGNLAATLQKIQAKARTIFVDVGRDKVSNLAVTNLVLGTPVALTSSPTPLLATIHSYAQGPDARDQVRAQLLVGRVPSVPGDPPFDLRVAQEVPVRVGPGPNTVAFPYKFPRPGDYVVQVRLEGDALEPDDVRSAVITVKDAVPVLLVNGKPDAAEVYDRATEWLLDALNPFVKGPVPGNIPARPRVLKPREFSDAGLGDLTPYDCVFFCDVRGFDPPEVRRIETHLRRGGGVVFFLGDQVDLAEYNRLLYREGKGILPARLLGKQEAPTKHFFHFAVEDKAYREPPLDAFGDDRDRAALLAVRFRQYIRAEPAPRGGPRKVLSFMPQSTAEDRKVQAERLPLGDPALIEWQPPLPEAERRKREEAGLPSAARYRGRVVLFTSTANMDWNTWPASPSYLPFMQELLRYAVSGRLREQAVIVGELIEEFLPGLGAEQTVVMHTPEGRSETIKTVAQEENSVLRWTDTELSGVYRAVISGQSQERGFAVNVPTATDAQQSCESDLTRCTPEELQAAYKEWKFQVVKEPDEAVRTDEPGEAVTEPDLRPMGMRVARWLLLAMLVLLVVEVILAWRFGHYSAVAGTPGNQPAAGRLVPGLAGAFAAISFLLLGGVLLHAVWTGDFLGFLPDGVRRSLERTRGIDAPAPGEGSNWALEFTPYLVDAASDPWIVTMIALAGIALIVWVYRQEGRTASLAYKMLLSGLRACFLLLTLVVLLPLLQVQVQRQGWPDVVILIDDSLSMSVSDSYRDPEVQEAANRLAQAAGLSTQERLALAQALLTRGERDWLRTLLGQRKKVHVYHCSRRAHRLASVVEPGQLAGAVEAIQSLRTEPSNDSSQLGTAVRQVLNDFRGSSLSAIVMLTDGVTTEGEDLVKVARYAAQMRVPLYFVGLGDAHAARDLRLHDLQVEESVYVNDRVVFEVRLSGQGYNDLTVPVRLREKGSDKVLAEQKVKVGPQGKPERVRLVYQPTEPGEKHYVIDVPVQPDEADPDNNAVNRTILVREARLIKVLFIDGSARYDYRFVKALLERESDRTRGNKSIDLKVLLLDSDDDYAAQDRSALAEFPIKAELNQFDVVILGDVDPRPSPRWPKMTEHLKDLAEFVRERGGGLVAVAGEQFMPHAYKDSPLRDILPIEPAADRQPENGPRVEGYRLELTAVGRLHPIFRFEADEKRNEEVWSQLREMYWWAEGYRTKPAAEVLAVHPRVRARPEERGSRLVEGHPLVVQQFVGAGRCLFFGFNESWRWRWREEELRFNQFWIQTVRYLARSRLGRIDLRLDRQTPYRRGEPIRVTVRFPDDTPPPAPDTEVKVLVERRPPRPPGAKPAVAEARPLEVQTMQLARVEGSRSTYEGLLTRTPEGEYRFQLKEPPTTGPKPTAEGRVLAPPGEMEQLRMNQPDLERAAEETQGRFYNLAEAYRLPDELPAGTRITLSAPGRPWLLWNHLLILLLALLLLSLEWILRKRKWLL